MSWYLLTTTLFAVWGANWAADGVLTSLPTTVFFALAVAELSSVLETRCCAKALKPNTRLKENSNTFFIFCVF
jgi:hypothetical protein